mgnify:CR=1 FL=1
MPPPSNEQDLKRRARRRLIGAVALTLLAVMNNLHDGETNAIEGISHLALFAAFVALVAMGLL